jgi:hypothetical protein
MNALPPHLVLAQLAQLFEHLDGEIVVALKAPGAAHIWQVEPGTVSSAAATLQKAPTESFVPSPFQDSILAALEGRALRTDALGGAVGDRSRLFKPHGLKELREQGLVGWHSRLGFYRVDAPPPQLSEQKDAC